MQEPAVRVLQLQTPDEIRVELERVGADSALDEKIARAQFQVLKLTAVSLTLARLLYQELVMEGGQVVTAPRLEHVGEGVSDVLLCATRYQFNHLLVRLRWQPDEELQLLADEIERALDRFLSPQPALALGSHVFDWTRTVIMGIMNVTPDSFSGDALIQSGQSETGLVRSSVERARTLVANGADILDLGGESTRPDALPVPLETELQRVMPIVRALKQEFAMPLSIDTSKATVARTALEAGVHLVNDVTGLRGDPEMKHVVAAHNAPIVLMHNWLARGRPAQVADVIGVILDELRTQIDTALTAGIAQKNIVIDPGIGFGKTTTENLEILKRLAEFRVLGFPILIGPSRKGFISKATGVALNERDDGSLAAVVIGILHGANLVRVHDAQAAARAARMTNAIQTDRAQV